MSKDQVVLVRKNRPAWQDGLLNGVGGKIEPGEQPVDAMRREFEEEAGLRIIDWGQFLDLKVNDVHIYFFRAWAEPEQIAQVKSLTDEPIEVHYMTPTCPPLDMIPNLYWILPLARHGVIYYPTTVDARGDLA